MTASIAALALLAAVQAAPPVAPVEIGCDALVHPAGGEAAIVNAPGLRVLEGTAAEGPYRPALPPHTAAIRCDRTSIVPAEHDDKVILDLQIPLYITDRNARPSDFRAAVLEISGGRFRYRLLHGESAPGEEAAFQQRLNQYQNRLQAGN